MKNQECKHYVKAAAKLNLTLDITGVRENLHTLDMLLTSVDLYDEAEFCLNGTNEIEISSVSDFDGFESARFNNAMRAVADKFEHKFGKIGCTVKIIKRIPLGAGLGGSSAGAVCLLRALVLAAEATGKNIAIDTDFLLSIGSDMPFMYYGGAARITGVGEQVEAVSLPRLFFTVLIPRSGVDSKSAYALYDTLPDGRLTKNKLTATDADKPTKSVSVCGFSENPCNDTVLNNCETDNNNCDGNTNCLLPDKKLTVCAINKSNSLTFDNLIKILNNDLQPAAEKLNPEVGHARLMLEKAGAENIVMSGSGSAVSAVFNNPAAAFCFVEKIKLGLSAFIEAKQKNRIYNECDTISGWSAFKSLPFVLTLESVNAENAVLYTTKSV